MILSATSMSLRALIVDDSAAVRRILRRELEALSGLECLEAKNGVEGLKLATQVRFDILVTDVHMPELDGLKLIRAVRENLHLIQMPILVISSHAQESDRDRAIALGANEYVMKPLRPGEVAERVEKLLHAFK